MYVAFSFPLYIFFRCLHHFIITDRFMTIFNLIIEIFSYFFHSNDLIYSCMYFNFFCFLSMQVPHLEEGDIIIDGGNSEYQDTNRRTHDLKAKGILFIGTGNVLASVKVLLPRVKRHQAKKFSIRSYPLKNLLVHYYFKSSNLLSFLQFQLCKRTSYRSACKLVYFSHSMSSPTFL